MSQPSVFLSEWGDLQTRYGALLRRSSYDADAAEALARDFIDAGVPYSEFDAIHARAVEDLDPALDPNQCNHVRIAILAAYDGAFLGYRKLERIYRAEIAELRKRSHSLSTATDALAVSRDNLQTELSLKERVLLERSAELEVLNRRLEVQRDEMAGFLYSISHDVKAPMNTVYGLISLFLEDNADTGLDLTDLRDAMATAERTSTMLDDLMHFSQALDARPESETVDLDALVTAIFHDLSHCAKPPKPNFTKDRLPKVTGSAFQLRLLFQNLIANGAKFCPADRSAHVTVRNMGPRGISFCAIAVEDNGIGIDQQYHEKIFGLFNRLHTHREYPGTGIGLSLCQRIVLNHKGQFHLRSELGEGTKFTLVLPL